MQEAAGVHGVWPDPVDEEPVHNNIPDSAIPPRLPDGLQHWLGRRFSDMGSEVLRAVLTHYYGAGHRHYERFRSHCGSVKSATPGDENNLATWTWRDLSYAAQQFLGPILVDN